MLYTIFSYKTIQSKDQLFHLSPLNLQQNQNAIQLGYLISKDPLNKGEFSVADTGFRALVKRKNLDKNKNFVLGNNSLGAFFEDAGYAAVPSNKNKKPGKT